MKAGTAIFRTFTNCRTKLQKKNVGHPRFTFMDAHPGKGSFRGLLHLMEYCVHFQIFHTILVRLND